MKRELKELLDKDIGKVQVAILSVIIVIVAIAGVLLYVFPPTPPSERDYFKIGVVTELTGALSRGGCIAKCGYDTWADYVNEEGGILINGKSYRVELVYADAKSDPSEAAKAAEKLIGEGVDFILGPYGSATVLGLAPICDERKMPMVTGSAATHLLKPNRYQYCFQTFNTIDRISALIMDVLVEAFPQAKTIAIVGTDDAWGKGLVEGHAREALKRGLTVLLNEAYPLGTTEFGPIASKLKALNPDIVANCAHPTQHLGLIKASADLGLNPKVFYIIWGLDSPDLVKELGTLAEYVCGEAWWVYSFNFSDPLFGSTAKYIEIFNTRYGRNPDSAEATCTATGVAIQYALEKYRLTPPFNDEKRYKFIKALEEINVMTLAGRVDYATNPEDWHVNTARDIILLQIVKGTPYVIAPRHLREKEPVYPKPPFP